MSIINMSDGRLGLLHGDGGACRGMLKAYEWAMKEVADLQYEK